MQNDELRSARSHLESALERYTEVFDFAPIGYAVVSPDGEIREINHAGARALGGRERSRVVGRRFSMFVSREGRELFDQLLRDATDYARTFRVELDLKCDASIVPVRLSAARLARGEPALMLAFEDISERRAKEAELARSENALREASRRKDDFLAMLSHELRNPLSPIRTSVSVLQAAAPGSGEARSALAIIDRSCSHLTRLVDDLLDLTRIIRGKIELQCGEVELCQVVRDTVEDHAQSSASRSITVTVQYNVPSIWVYGDRARLAQVLSNIVGNAEKFTKPGGRVHIEVGTDDRRALISVADDGVGISPDVIETVFEPFTQGPQSLDRSFGGLGLGLAMVKSIVELHGGHAAIHSAGVGRGTQVSLLLPMHERRTASISDGPPAFAGQCKVLVVEDKVDSAEALRYALTLKGHSVAVAHDGRTAVTLAQQFGPDVVLCDLGLPDMDGYAVAREIRRTALLRGVCLVALSGYARAEDVARAHDAGFDRHIAKPPRLEELDQVLASVRRNTTGL